MMKKAIILVCSLLLLLCVALGAAASESAEQQGRYGEALAAAEAGRYMEAAEMFAGLGDYLDSEDKAYVLGVASFAEETVPQDNGTFFFSHHGVWGMVNYRDNIAVPARFDSIGSFTDGRAVYRLDGLCGLLYPDGRITPAEWNTISPFREVMGAVLAEVERKNLHGYINDQGETVLNAEWSAISEFNGDGVCLIARSNSRGGSTVVLLGLADYTGNILTSPKYTALGNSAGDSLEAPPEDGLPIPVRNTQGKWGYITGRGTAAFDAEYEEARAFSEGLAAVRKSDKWGFIDESGNMVIQPQYKEVTSFRDGRADVLDPGSGWHIIGTDNTRIYFVNTALRKAQKLWDEGKPAEAVNAYAAAMKIDPSDRKECEEAIYTIAGKQQEAGDYTGAIESYTVLGKYKDAPARIAEIHNILGEEAMQEERWEDAADEFTAAGDRQKAADVPKEADYRTAGKLLEAGDYAGAYRLYYTLRNYRDAAQIIRENSRLRELFLESNRKAVSEVGGVIFFGHYEQDNDPENGAEEIEWIVLDVSEGKALLLSVYGLDRMKYNEKVTDTSWEKCTLRKWLNNDFLKEAFSGSEQQIIQKTRVNNGETQMPMKKRYGKDTDDKIFLLSPTELETYLPGKTDQDCTATVYTNSKGPSYTEGRMPYWLRSYVKKPKLKPSAYYRTGAGSIASIEVDSTLAIRPAVWIDTEQYIASLSADMPTE